MPALFTTIATAELDGTRVVAHTGFVEWHAPIDFILSLSGCCIVCGVALSDHSNLNLWSLPRIQISYPHYSVHQTLLQRNLVTYSFYL